VLDRARSALRDRFVRAVADGTRPHFTASGAQLVELHAELGRLQQRLDAVESGLADRLAGWERRTRHDILTVADQQAAHRSADFWRTELSTALAHFAPHDTLRAALAQAPRDGLYLEFGVATGSTLRVIAEHAPAGSVHGFDSFAGLPEHWRCGYPIGEFAQAQLPDVPGAELVVGLFDDTLPGFLDQHPEPVAFLHVDADLYSSTRTVLEALHPRLRAGTVVVFDEYFNFPGWEQHEHRAWTEFCAASGVTFEYLGFTADGQQLSVRLLDVPEGVADRRIPAPRAAENQPV
jgi:predicted O-methyltransferase YrrM